MCVQVKAEVQGRIASSGETGELLQQLERAEEMTKGRKEKVEHCERIISENQQRLGSVQEGRADVCCVAVSLAVINKPVFYFSVLWTLPARV